MYFGEHDLFALTAHDADVILQQIRQFRAVRPSAHLARAFIG